MNIEYVYDTNNVGGKNGGCLLNRKYKHFITFIASKSNFIDSNMLVR